RPADDLAPEFAALKEKYKDLVRCDEDVLSIALFEAVAVKFLTSKYYPSPKETVETDEFNVYIGGILK
ncbi:MAG: hypothetical protein PHQ30_05295, partial [Candidatus Izemoplasmatales bacterium]|nr:hypothetical protein [Candidatus Izemoplasmatales bacterium]